MLSLVYVFLLTDWLRHHAAHARSYRRLCKNEIDVLSSEGVYVEKYERSHVELPLADLSSGKRYESATIKFEFRTKEENGLLFYGRREDESNELVAMNLTNGHLFYVIHCSTVSANVLIPHQQRLNDNTWHSVLIRFRRGGNKIRTQVEVDGIRDTKMYEVSCGPMTSLVFGGVRPQDKAMIKRKLVSYEHYEGCIRRVNMPYALRQPPKYYAISSCERDAEEPDQRLQDQSLPGHDGYVESNE